MAGRCCDKPIAKIIMVGDIEVGILGLEEAFAEIYRMNIKDEEKLKSELLTKIRESGNYITPSREEIYKESLLREYKKFDVAVKAAIERRKIEQKGEKKKWSLFKIIKKKS